MTNQDKGLKSAHQQVDKMFFMKANPFKRIAIEHAIQINMITRHKVRNSSSNVPQFILCVIILIVLRYFSDFSNLASAHIVLTKDDHGSSLVLTGEDGKGGKGKGGGDQLVIAGHNMGGNERDTNMVMQDAANKEGDVVIHGNSMIVPGQDGHIVLADSRSKSGGAPRPMINPMMFWLPYMSSRSMYRILPFYFSHYGR